MTSAEEKSSSDHDGKRTMHFTWRCKKKTKKSPTGSSNLTLSGFKKFSAEFDLLNPTSKFSVTMEVITGLKLKDS